MDTQTPRYLAYLVRLWQVQDRGVFVWRASLEDAHTGERRGFASLEALLAFLQAQTGVSAAPREPPPARSGSETDPPLAPNSSHFEI